MLQPHELHSIWAPCLTSFPTVLKAKLRFLNIKPDRICSRLWRSVSVISACTQKQWLLSIFTESKCLVVVIYLPEVGECQMFMGNLSACWQDTLISHTKKSSRKSLFTVIWLYICLWPLAQSSLNVTCFNNTFKCDTLSSYDYHLVSFLLCDNELNIFRLWPIETFEDEALIDLFHNPLKF